MILLCLPWKENLKLRTENLELEEIPLKFNELDKLVTWLFFTSHYSLFTCDITLVSCKQSWNPTLNPIIYTMKTFPGQHKNEKVLYLTTEHPISFLNHNIGKIFVFTMLGFFIFFLIWFFIWYTLIWLITGLAIALGGITYLFLTRIKTKYIITNKRVIKFTKSGAFIFYKKEIALADIKENIATQKWILNKIFNLGNVKIIWWGIIWFRGIKYPEEVSSYLWRLANFLKENPNYDYKQIKEFIPRKIRKTLSPNN